MGRSRYRITEPDQPHFVTCTVLEWHPELIGSEAMMRQKVEYIHFNPVKRGYVDLPEHWRRSSARCYLGEEGLLEVRREW